MNELVPVVEQLTVEVVLDETEDLLQERIQGDLVGADYGHRELRPLEQVLRSDFRGRDLELVSDPRFQTADDHPLLLQAATAGQMEVEDGVGENH